MGTLTSYPQWLDKEAWEGFEVMRKTMRKPLTPRAATMILVKLQRMKDSGQDPNEVLDQSTNHCWADVYPIKEDRTEASGKLPEYKPEPTQASKPPGWFKDKHIRRVA